MKPQASPIDPQCALIAAVKASNAAGVPFVDHEPDPDTEDCDLDYHGQHERFTPSH
jgi:hypothetical protein